ncbi:MAG: CHAP domain-containing protein [Gammaproteobacteria bacterium]|nr:CHAP domain-containing protein [Gammaproteobacteria bacterium]
MKIKRCVVFTLLVILVDGASYANELGNLYEQEIAPNLDSIHVSLSNTTNAIKDSGFVDITATVQCDDCVPAFYWKATGGLFQSLSSDYSKVRWYPDDIKNASVHYIHCIAQNGKGKISDSYVRLVVTNSDITMEYSNNALVIKSIEIDSSTLVKLNNSAVDAVFSSDGSLMLHYNQNDIIDAIYLEIIKSDGSHLYSGCFPFKDVCPGRWYTRPVMKLWKEGVIEGYADGTPGIFGPHNPALRAELVATAVRAIELGNTPAIINTPPFDDVSTDDWYAVFVAYAKNMDLVQGCDSVNNLFCPADPVSRAAAAKVIALSLFVDAADDFANGQEPAWLFSDVQNPDNWFYPFVYALQDAQAAHGYPDGSFGVGNNLTRAEMAKAICIAAYGASECIASGDENLPMVLTVTPSTAIVGESVTLSMEGFFMPMPLMMTLPGCDNLSATGTATAEKQDFTCTPVSEGMLNGQITDAEGMVLFEFTLDVQADEPSPSLLIAVSPDTATVNQPVTLSVEGSYLPVPVTMTLPGCDGLTAAGSGTEEKQDFICTPANEGVLNGQITDAEGTVLFEFTVNVQADEPQSPVEPGGAAENPGDATQLFILNGTMTTSCTFKDVVQNAWYAESVNALCSAGILVGYWEDSERVFVKLDEGLSEDARHDPAKNKFIKTNVAETLKVFLFGLDYAYFGLNHDPGDGNWYALFVNEAESRGLDLFGLAYDSAVTRKQAMTWLAQLYYGYTGDDPIGLLQNQGLVSSDNDPRPDDPFSRYELAYLAYTAILDTGKKDGIPFGLWGEPAPKPQPLGSDIAAKALDNVGVKHPYTDGQYTYCARFVRMMFDKSAVWPDAKNMCNAYEAQGVMHTDQNPPVGAAVCYLPNSGNGDYGHVAIAMGDGMEVGATSLVNGVTQRNSVYGSAYQGWIKAEDFSNHYPN